LVGTFHHRLGRLRTDRDAAGFIVIEEIIAEVFQGDVGFLFVHEILKVVSHEVFISSRLNPGSASAGTTGVNDWALEELNFEEKDTVFAKA
jgi:hypothetical protein